MSGVNMSRNNRHALAADCEVPAHTGTHRETTEWALLGAVLIRRAPGQNFDKHRMLAPPHTGKPPITAACHCHTYRPTGSNMCQIGQTLYTVVLKTRHELSLLQTATTLYAGTDKWG